MLKILDNPISKNSNVTKKSGFTLLELLIVIGILATLATVAIMAINPGDLLKRGRDSRRLGDLSALNGALALIQGLNPGLNMGSPNIVYTSLPDTASTTCGTWGLPALPSGWNYNCASEQNLQKVSGIGWVPVDFTSAIGINSPLANLPIDPINASTSNQYYTYVAGGSWELNALLESSKYRQDPKINKTNLPGVLTVGTNLSLSPIFNNTGLVGYWKFDEGSGTTANDSSGNGNTSTWYGSGQHYATGKVGSYAGQFNGNDDRLSAPNNGLLLNSGSVEMWIRPAENWGDIGLGRRSLISWGTGPGWSANYCMFKKYQGSSNSAFYCYNTNSTQRFWAGAGDFNFAQNSWHFLVVTWSTSEAKIYIDGAFSTVDDTLTISDLNIGTTVRIGGDTFGEGGDYFNGLIDDVRVYNRALSAAEIMAIYNATK